MTHVIAAYIEPRFLVGETPVFGMAGCGAFAEEMVVPQEGAIKIADDVPFELAALVGCGVVTGVGAVINTAQVEPGASVAVIGCGGVSIAAIQGARLSGAAVIVAVDPVEAKHAVARRFGATHAVHPDHVGDLSAELTGGEGFDYAFEVVGTPQTIRAAWSTARAQNSIEWSVLISGILNQFEIGHFEPCSKVTNKVTIGLGSGVTDTTWLTCHGAYEAAGPPDPTPGGQEPTDAFCFRRGSPTAGLRRPTWSPAASTTQRRTAIWTSTARTTTPTSPTS